MISDILKAAGISSGEVRFFLRGCVTPPPRRPPAPPDPIKDVRVGFKHGETGYHAHVRRIDANERLIVAMAMRQIVALTGIGVAVGISRETVRLRLRILRVPHTPLRAERAIPFRAVTASPSTPGNQSPAHSASPACR